MRVVCAGHVNWDVHLRLDRLPEADGEALIRDRSEGGGGSAANVAVGLAGLGGDPCVIGSVGDDDRGRRTVARLEAQGVDTRIQEVPDEPTTIKYVLVADDGEVAILGSDGANEALAPEDVSASLVADADWLHLTGQHPATARRLAELAADRDIPVSFDPGRRVTDRAYDGVLERTDLLFATEREAAATDTSVPRRVTKYGPDGASVSGPEGSVEHEGYAVDGPVNSAGAGDAFAAGFLAVWLEDTDPDPERALAVACACGSLATREPGSQSALSWERIDALL